MCHRVTCRTCGKATYAGCGQHVERVLGHLPPDQRCSCPESADRRTPDPAAARSGAGRARLARLFGR